NSSPPLRSFLPANPKTRRRVHLCRRRYPVLRGRRKKGRKKVVKGPDSSVKKEEKEKKVYDLPSQKRDPPEERDPLRIFYESLYSQIPTSEMAAIWMMESGLLHKDVAKKLFEAKRKKAQQQKLGLPMKTIVNVMKHFIGYSQEKGCWKLWQSQKGEGFLF
ncbi:uncharacterized protein LOC118483965, partial [Helianthus annuus]|uniref:uncharacterized protein LOC118483965 n=1 Tax=Helianthus annuus TaxID=4232 RepID=UPI001652D1C9